MFQLKHSLIVFFVTIVVSSFPEKNATGRSNLEDTIEFDNLLCSHCIFNTSNSKFMEELNVDRIVEKVDAFLNDEQQMSPIENVNCSLILSSLPCEYCNNSQDCSKGYCKIINQRPSPTPGNVFGLCQKRGLLRGTVFHPDPMGKIISFGLLSLFLSVIVAVCLRMFCTACSWRKCCVCQCSVSIQWCCEPKPPPRLRVIPATGDAETATRSALSPSPPPAYMEIYPDTSDTTFTSININHLGPPVAREAEAENPSLLNPLNLLNDADVRSLTPPAAPGPPGLSLEAEDRLGVPSLGAGGQAQADHQARAEAGEGEGSDWASVASFPIHDEEAVNNGEDDVSVIEIFNPNIRNSFFTVQRNISPKNNSIRPTTC